MMTRIATLLSLLLVSPALGEPPAGHARPEYQEVKARLAQGWNTWNTRSVLSYVLLPEGFAVNLAFKQHYWLDEKYLAEALIGRRGEGVEQITPGLHAWDGRFSELTLEWEEVVAKIEVATDGDDLVVLVTPLVQPKNRVKLIVESALPWNRPGHLSTIRTDAGTAPQSHAGETPAPRPGALRAELTGRTVDVYTTGEPVDDPYVPTRTPYLAVYLDRPIGISSGRARTLDEILTVIELRRRELHREAEHYGELADAYLAVESGISWNTIYEPQHDRVVSTVGRLWNEEYGGYCLFGWDNFFLAYVTTLSGRDLAYANVIEHLRGKTEEGFVPNDNRGNGSKSFDRSQPPVGSIMVREVYRRYPERWFLEATFDDLLGWNRWWVKKRLNEGLLAYGSHEAENPYHEPAVRTMRTAGYESGTDDSPMYEGVVFNPEKNTMELQDVGLTSLHIADSKALAEIARILGREAEERELLDRATQLEEALDRLWDEDTGFYLNRRTDTGELSHRLSPTLFYPLLARAASPERARRIVDEHLRNPEEFWGEYMIPSIARNDPAFERQRYWKGAIWPPLNFLTYLALRQYGMTEEHGILAEKSLSLFLREWRRMGYVSENYSAITGTGDDPRLSSDRFHSWGTLMGMIAFIEEGHVGRPEAEIPVRDLE